MLCREARSPYKVVDPIHIKQDLFIFMDGDILVFQLLPVLFFFSFYEFLLLVLTVSSCTLNTFFKYVVCMCLSIIPTSLMNLYFVI